MTLERPRNTRGARSDGGHASAGLPVALLLVALATGQAASHSLVQVDDREQVDEGEALAREKYAEDDLEGARTLYRQLAENAAGDGARARYLVMVSGLSFALGDVAQSSALVRRALALDPDAPLQAHLFSQGFVDLFHEHREELRDTGRQEARDLIRQALRALEGDRYDAARRLLREALGHDPTSPTGLYNLALLDLRQGRQDDALTGFQKLLALDDAGKLGGRGLSAERRAQVLTNMGLLYYHRGYFQDAERVLEEAREVNPESARAWSHLGLVRRELGRGQEAVAAFAEARRIDPDDPETKAHLAVAYMDLEQWSRARELLLAASREPLQRPQVWLNLGLVHRALGESANAIASLRRAWSLDRDNRQGFASRALSWLALVSYETGDPAAALDYAQRSLALDEEDGQTWLYLGMAHRAQGDLAGARHSLEKARELEPSRADTLNNLGSVYFDLGHLAQARDAFRQALDIQPDLGQARDNLARVEAQLRSPGRGSLPLSLPARSRPNPGAGPRDGTRAFASPEPPSVGGAPVGVRFLGLVLRQEPHDDAGGNLVRVQAVSLRGLGARVGLKSGDLIYRLNGQDPGGVRELENQLSLAPRGTTCILGIFRNDRPLRLRFRLE